MARIKPRSNSGAWGKLFELSLNTMTRHALHASARAMSPALRPVVGALSLQPDGGHWVAGIAIGLSGARRFRLYRPPDVRFDEHLPLMVMLHGCGQDATSFATSTRMNQLAARERFLVLYPEQDRLANAHGCWNWFDTTTGRAYSEVALIMKAIDQVCLLYPVDRQRVAVAGLSAGASMAALLVTRHPDRFKAVVMHSGIPPGTAHSTLSALGAMHGHRVAKPLVAVARTLAAPWPPLMVIHGGSDHVVSTHNGHAAVQIWAEAADALEGKARLVQRGKRYPMTVTEFKCEKSTVATLVEVSKLGHAWSGGALSHPFSDNQGPDASRMAWAFALKQFRQRGLRSEPPARHASVRGGVW